MTPEDATRSAARTAVPCSPCFRLDCEECLGVVEDRGLKVRCPCAEAGHEGYWDDADWQAAPV
jgi:hypothetical protein